MEVPGVGGNTVRLLPLSNADDVDTASVLRSKLIHLGSSEMLDWNDTVDISELPVNELLKAAPGVQVVATSRARLNVQSEHLKPISGMACPARQLTPSARGPKQVSSSVRDATQYSAVQLFLAAARRFFDEIGAERRCVVLTAIPNNLMAPALAESLARELGVAYLAVSPEGLTTMDKLHLDKASAEKWFDVLSEKLTPYLQACPALSR